MLSVLHRYCEFAFYVVALKLKHQAYNNSDPLLSVFHITDQLLLLRTNSGGPSNYHKQTKKDPTGGITRNSLFIHVSFLTLFKYKVKMPF